MSSDTVHFWPGGVPADLTFYRGQEKWFIEVEEEIKGWLLFVKVSLPYFSKVPIHWYQSGELGHESTLEAAGEGEGAAKMAEWTPCHPTPSCACYSGHLSPMEPNQPPRYPW